MPIAQGGATLGPIPFAEVWQVTLFQARKAEPALAVNVAGQGIVIITGCGHQTLPKLLTRAQALFAEPHVGIVGGFQVGRPITLGELTSAARIAHKAAVEQ